MAVLYVKKYGSFKVRHFCFAGIWVFLSSRYDVVHGLAWPSGLANLVTLHSLGYFGFDWRDLWRVFKIKNGPKSRSRNL